MTRFSRPQPTALTATALTALLLALTSAQARPVAIGGAVQPASAHTQQLDGVEMLAVWTLPRLGVAARNDSQGLRLHFGEAEVQYSRLGGWRGLGVTLPEALPAPRMLGGSLHVPVAAVLRLGVPVLVDGEVLDFAAPLTPPQNPLPPTQPQTSVPAAPPASGEAPFLNTVRVGTEMHRTVEVRRVVLELSGEGKPRFDLQTGTAGTLTVRLAGVAATPGVRELADGQRLSLSTGAGGTSVKLSAGAGQTRAFALSDPPRVVIDTFRQTNPDVPPPLNPAALPEGVTYRQLGSLHLMSFDPARFEPRIVSAPQGGLSTVDQLVGSVGGVAGVNASYFALASGLPVDLVVRGGLMLSPSLEKRGTVGFLPEGGLLFGYPRPRYRLSGDFGAVYANSVSSNARPDWLTAFVGDGKTTVGRGGLLTLHTSMNSGGVLRVELGPHVPPAGTLTFTFDPLKFPGLPREVGAPLTAALDWRTSQAGWNRAEQALSAGPLLVSGGRVVTDPEREGFDTATNVWRPTRQVALGIWQGQPTVAYFEHGTPEAFAAALAGAGLSEALRLDSGSSATLYARAGYGNFGGYVNTVWSRPVPNAVVFVAREQ